MLKRTVRLVAGIMTGTSLDGLDAVLARIEGHGIEMRVATVARLSLSLGRLAPRLRALAEQQPCTAATIAELSHDFSLLHVQALRRLQGRRRLDLAVIHGQTVFHAPPLSWQMLTPAVIAHGIRAPVISDLRAADLAAGGEGAPITPLADLVLYGDADVRTTVVNLGGFCNLTALPAGRHPQRIRGGDVCACNQVLDGVARAVLGKAYDRHGAMAAGGEADARATAALVTALDRQRQAKRSLGTGDELQRWIHLHRQLAPATLARSACAAVATVIATAIGRTGRVVLAGGGVRNRTLTQELRQRCRAPVLLSDELGIAAEDREALAMAVLGALSSDGVPITLRVVTGVRRPPIAGSRCG